MPFELVPEADPSADQAARAALAATGLVSDGVAPAYGNAWRRAAAEEAAGYVDDLQADAVVAAPTRRHDRGSSRTPSDPQTELP